MVNKKINSLQFGIIIFFFIFASQIGIGINFITYQTGKDAVISVILSYIIGFIPLIIFIYLFNHKKNIIELINNVFGKFFGRIINYILLIPILVICACYLNSISNFLVSQFLTETPVYIIYISISIVIIYAVYKGIESVSRTALVLSVVSFLFLFISVIGLIPCVKLDNFLPILENGIGSDISYSVLFVLSSIIPCFILLFLSKDNINDKKNITKSVIISYSLGMFVALIGSFFTIGTLGVYLTKIYQYPEYMMLKKISFFNFFNRIENLIAIQWLYLNLLVIVMSIFYVKKLTKRNDKNVCISFISMIIIFLFCKFVFKNNTIFVNFTQNIYPYFNLGYFIIMLIISLIIFVKEKKSRN